MRSLNPGARGPRIYSERRFAARAVIWGEFRWRRLAAHGVERVGGAAGREVWLGRSLAFPEASAAPCHGGGRPCRNKSLGTKR